MTLKTANGVVLKGDLVRGPSNPRGAPDVRTCNMWVHKRGINYE